MEDAAILADGLLDGRLDAAETALAGLGDLATKDTVAAGDIDANAVTTGKILDANVTDAKLANMGDGTIKGRARGVGTGVPVNLTPAQVRTLAALVPGTDVQADHANLTALAGLVGASDRAFYFTGVGALSLHTLTTFGRTLAALADATPGRTALGAAPSDASYITESAESGLSAEFVLGSAVIPTATQASRQAAAKAGRLFLPSDGLALKWDTGTAWVPGGPFIPSRTRSFRRLLG